MTFDLGSLPAVGSQIAVDGELVTVVGSNGAGKSTLLNAVAGVIAPQQGRVIVGGQDVTAWSEHRRANLVGRVFQNPLDGTAAGMTVEENLALAVPRFRALVAPRPLVLSPAGP